jgi:hypothetical protein
VLSAAGAAVDATAAVLGSELSRGLVLTRPPGHHAEADRAMGFCLEFGLGASMISGGVGLNAGNAACR